MTDKVIIFGANSQDGHYLTDIYVRKGYVVFGVSRTGNYIRGDVSSFDFVEKIIKHYKPKLIFHIAANSTTSHESIFENYGTIVTGTLNILEALYRCHSSCKFFISGSGLQFLNCGQPIHETDAFDPSSPYSLARICSVYAARYFRTIGIKAYVGYLFHHESPFRKQTHISQSIAQATKRIAAGSHEIIELGDISVEKEWAFAGDIAEGIAILMEQEDVFEAVIGTGKTHTIEDWLNLCFKVIGKNWHDYVVINKDYVAEYRRLISNPETIFSLGWQPKMGLPQLAKLMLNTNIQA